MSCQVGNEAARDPIKHTAAYIVRAAVSAVVPSAGMLTSVHYDKRGGKLTFPYSGADCGGEKDKVEEAANAICEKNTPMNQLSLPDADKTSMASFETTEPKEVVGIMLKKFTANPAKEQLIIEFVTGKKSEAPSKKPEADAPKKKESKETAAKRKPTSYDDIRQVSDSILDELIKTLKAQGVQLDGKEESLRATMTDSMETPLVMLKNTAYTNGYSSRITQPIGNFIVKR